ncbi:MAG: DNA polymerase III subunit delta [Planctomycetes bacterium]|nr:DNA polymerase III subunit delta [Planctomycetota bacterium]
MAARRTKPAAAPKLDASMRVVILRGPEQFLREAHTRRLVEALEAAHGEIEQFTFDGTSVEPAVVLDELRSYGLLQTHKLVIVDQADKLLAAAKETAAGHKSPRELMERYAAAPVDSATLLLRAETWRPGRLDKAVEKVGAIIKCDVPDEATAVAWCAGRSRKEYGCSITSEAASMLVERAGAALARLDAELGKLAAYVGPGAEIGPDAIREMVGLSREEQAWAIQSTLLSGSAAASVGKIRELLEISRQPEQLVTWAMTDMLRKTHAASQLLRRGEAAGSIARDLRLWGNERHTLLAAAKAVGPGRLAHLLADAIRTDQKAKSGVGHSARSLEVLAVEIADTLG